jgi:uncharacterized membrane protein
VAVKHSDIPPAPTVPVPIGRHAARPDLAVPAVAGSLLVLLGVLVVLQRSWAAEVLTVPLLLLLPGVLLLRALRVPGAAVASCPVYVPAASLAVLIASGLAVDVIGPLVGVSQPLRADPLLVGIELSCAALIAVSLRAPASTAIPWQSLDRPGRLAWPLIIPLIAAAGALRLNSGHGNAVAVAAVCAGLAVLVWAAARAPRMSDASLGVILYALSLAVMWAYSLRGDLVYGFDISTEYHSLHQTVLAGVWHFAHPGDAYGALLSVTVLPAELHFLSGVSDLMVLKLLYPAIVATFPVAVYSLGRRIVDGRWAFVAASFVLIQTSFAQELPALARQEIALLFFIAMLGAMFDPQLPRFSRWTLAAVFGAGMALSHYSTTYFAIGMLALVLALQWAVSWFRELPRVTGAFAVALIAATATAAIWYGPLTRSASNVSQFVSAATSQGLDLLPNQVSGENLISSYLNGNTQTTMSAAQYQRLVQAHYAAQEKFVVPFPDAGQARYRLRDSSAPEPPVRLGSAHSLIGLGELVAEQLAELLAAVAAVILALRRKTPPLARQLALLGVGTLLALAVIRFSGTVADAYNQQRAFVQAFAVLGIAMAWSLEYLGARLRRWQVCVTVAAVVGLAVIFADMSGLAGAALGGGTDSNLANSGEDYERYYMTTPELAAARWLGQQVRPGQLVYADRYGELRLNAETSITKGLLNDITPLTLAQNAWVYASTSNIVDGRARQLFENQLVSYAFPIGFLDANFNVLYTNGSSEVFHG